MKMLETSPWIRTPLETWEPLLEGTRPISYKKKASLYHQGDLGENIFICRTGRVRVTYYHAGGEEKLLYIAEQGSMVGETACVTNTCHNSSGIALTDALIYRIPREKLLAAMERDWTLNQQIIGLICRKKSILFHQMLELSFSQALGRIARMLLNLVSEYGIPQPGGAVLIDMTFTHQEVASLVNTSRVTVSNVFHQCASDGLLEKQGSRFVVLRPQELQRIAETFVE